MWFFIIMFLQIFQLKICSKTRRARDFSFFNIAFTLDFRIWSKRKNLWKFSNVYRECWLKLCTYKCKLVGNGTFFLYSIYFYKSTKAYPYHLHQKSFLRSFDVLKFFHFFLADFFSRKFRRIPCSSFLSNFFYFFEVRIFQGTFRPFS